MGTWGKGNFDSDTAADHLSDLTARDRSIDALGPSDEYVRDRRAVLVQTFDRLLAAIARA